MRSEPEPVAIDADVLMNLLATGCAAEIVRSLNILLLAAPAVAAEALYLESEDAGGEREQMDLTRLEDAGVLASLVLEDSEVDLVVELAQIVDDGEAEVIAVALSRGITMATDDRKARRVATGRGAALVSTPDLLHRWQASADVTDQRMTEVLHQVSRRSHYRPPAHDALFQWWMTLVAGR